MEGIRVRAMVGKDTDKEANGGPGGDGRPMRVVVPDDDPFARRMIKESLQRAGITAVAEAHNGHQAVELALFYQPAMLLMDVVMPELDGIAATRRIVQELPHQLVVMLTSSDEDEMGFVGLRAGAVGYLSKDLDVDILPQALEGAREVQAAISRRLSMQLIEELRRVPEPTRGMRPVKSPLTPREWEVIDLLYEGRTTDEIADILVLSTETVRSHIKNLMRKLGARSRQDAVAKAHH